MSHETPDKPIRRPLLSPDLLLTALVAIIVSLTMLGLYDAYRYQPVMTVDVERIMESRMEGLKKQLRSQPTPAIDKEAIVQQSRQWAEQLAREVKRLNTEYNAIVLTRPAVIEGSVDMTQTVMNRMGQPRP